jgi:hypothetical protein
MFEDIPEREIFGDTPLVSDAIISDDGKYRFSLTRRWGSEEDGFVVWVMLNPSTADASQNDATIRRCMRFAKDWGYGGIEVVNLYAYRSRDPSVLSSMPREEAVGGGNNGAIFGACTRVFKAPKGMVVAGWGARAIDPVRIREVRGILAIFPAVHCLGTTVSGSPRHPLMVRANYIPEYYARNADRTVPHGR